MYSNWGEILRKKKSLTKKRKTRHKTYTIKNLNILVIIGHCKFVFVFPKVFTFISDSKNLLTKEAIHYIQINNTNINSIFININSY